MTSVILPLLDGRVLTRSRQVRGPSRRPPPYSEQASGARSRVEGDTHKARLEAGTGRGRRRSESVRRIGTAARCALAGALDGPKDGSGDAALLTTRGHSTERDNRSLLQPRWGAGTERATRSGIARPIRYPFPVGRPSLVYRMSK